MADIGAWLTRLGLSKYIDIFVANEIDLDALRLLVDQDLKELGLPLGPRRKIMRAIRSINEHDELPSPVWQRDAERRQLTVMFVDLVGSTELTQRLDLEEMREAISVYQRTVSAEIRRYDGQVAKLMGDGVLAYFGWPQAHEDDAERAVRAALSAIVAVASYKSPLGNALAARIGIATGEVVVGEIIGEGSAREEAVVGQAPNLASRLQALAEPNSVVIAESTYRLTADLFEMADLGQRKLKGFSGEVGVWRVVGERAVEGWFARRRGTEMPLVGRAAELGVILNCWEKARTGKGQVVLVSGEPGIGKSRLIRAVEERLAGEPRSLHCFCSPHHVSSAFYPIVQLIENGAGIRKGDESDAKLSKLKDFLSEASSDTPEILGLVAELLSIEGITPVALSPQARRTWTNAALINLLIGLAARQPVLLIIEDIHWVDPTSNEWLEAIVGPLRNLPILLALSFRRGFHPGWKNMPHVNDVALVRLADHEGAKIVKRVADGRTIPRQIEDQILARSEGVPLFVEELTKAAIDIGIPVDGGDSSQLPGPAPVQTVPVTLQDSLMARLDRLGTAKELAQIGACIGRVFHYRLIAGVVGADGTGLTEALQRLEESELVFREGTPPEATYTYKHALIQNTAYDCLLRKRRREIHAQIAVRLEADFPEIVAAEPETIAYHHTAAGSAQKAAPYWLKAGQAALKRSAHREASAHLSKGVEIIAPLPDSEERLKLEIELQTALGVTMMGAKGFGAPEVLQAMSRARILSEKLGDDEQLFRAICGEASYHMISGQLRESDALGEKCIALAATTDNEGLKLEAHHRQWATKFFMGNYRIAEQHIEQGLAIYEPERHHNLTYTHTGHDPGVCCRSYSASVLWLRGYLDQAVERASEGVALAERLSHPHSLALASKAASEVLLLRRQPSRARPLIAEWEAMSNRHAFPLLTTQAQFQRGWALSEEGQAEKGVVEMQEGVASIRATGAAMGLQHFLCVLAQGYARCCMAIEALAVLEEALEFAARTDAKYQYPELLRTKGELLLGLDPSDCSAEDWFHLSLVAAREEGTRILELRAAASLARHAQGKGKSSQARRELQLAYAWFTEGFDTPDLMDAKNLLEELE